MSKQVGSMWLIGSGLLFGLYCLNVILGKLATGTGEGPIFSMGDVGEFMVLFASVICLIVTMLQRETQLEK